VNTFLEELEPCVGRRTLSEGSSSLRVLSQLPLLDGNAMFSVVDSHRSPFYSSHLTWPCRVEGANLLLFPTQVKEWSPLLGPDEARREGRCNIYAQYSKYAT
jgi:hypothetical protein